MQRFSKILLLALLVTAASVSGGIGISVDQLIPPTPAPAVAQSAPIPVSLPDLAVITLKDGGKRSGKVVGFDPQKQTLLLQRDGDSLATPLNQISKVVYDQQAQFYREQGPPVIRGEQAPPKGDPSTWRNVPLNSFSIHDASRGQATVLLDSVLPSTQLRGVRSVASSSTYVVDAMQFNLPQKTMALSVTPY